MANRVVITGRLVADPELRKTPSDTSVTKFRIACKRPFSKEEKADFFDVVAWRGSGEFVCKYFSKGKLIEVDGTLQTNPWEDKNGGKHQGVIIVAQQVGFVGDKPKETSAQNTTAPSVTANCDMIDDVDNEELPF